MLALLLSSALALAPAEPPILAEPEPSEDADLREAARLFDEGQIRYEAADYEAAIEIFTQALAELSGQGVDDVRIRSLLLFNIGRAHMRAYDIGREVEHLRQAEAIFNRFIEQADEAEGEDIAAEDVAAAKQQLEVIAAKLDALDAPPAPIVEALASDDPAAPAEQGDRVPPDPAAATRARKLGVGLTATGVALIGGGVGLLVYGAGFGPQAQSQADELDALGLPADHPAFAEADQFVADERQKGVAWMAAGGAAAGLGVVGLAVGIQQLVKANKLASGRVSAIGGVDGRGAFVGVRGRF